MIDRDFVSTRKIKAERKKGKEHKQGMTATRREAKRRNEREGASRLGACSFGGSQIDFQSSDLHL
jgi:hypothetical protein